MATTEEPNENDRPTSTINFIYLILTAGNTISSLL